MWRGRVGPVHDVRTRRCRGRGAPRGSLATRRRTARRGRGGGSQLLAQVLNFCRAGAEAALSGRVLRGEAGHGSLRGGKTVFNDGSGTYREHIEGPSGSCVAFKDERKRRVEHTKSLGYRRGRVQVRGGRRDDFGAEGKGTAELVQDSGTSVEQPGELHRGDVRRSRRSSRSRGRYHGRGHRGLIIGAQGTRGGARDPIVARIASAFEGVQLGTLNTCHRRG